MNNKEFGSVAAFRPPDVPERSYRHRNEFWMVSVEFDHRLPAEWFPSQIQPQLGPGPHEGNQWIWHRKIMLFTGRSALNVFRTLLRPGNHPHDTPKVSETIWYHGSGYDPHNPEISTGGFFLTKKNRICSHPLQVLQMGRVKWKPQRKPSQLEFFADFLSNPT